MMVHAITKSLLSPLRHKPSCVAFACGGTCGSFAAQLLLLAKFWFAVYVVIIALLHTIVTVTFI